MAESSLPLFQRRKQDTQAVGKDLKGGFNSILRLK